MKRAILICAAATWAASCFAAPFDNSTGTAATAVLNPAGGGDYTSLAAAATAFNAVTGGINRPWTLQVDANTTITEATDVYLANSFGAQGSLTIKPAPGTQPTFAFTNLTPGTGVIGHFVIGCTTGAAAASSTNSFSSNGKYVIDGSNTTGGTTRDMTFSMPTGNDGSNTYTIRIFGDNDGVVIKNCNIHNRKTGSTSSLSSTAVGLGGGKLSDTNLAVTPDNCQIVNNWLQATPTSITGNGVESVLNASGTVASAEDTITGTVITGNDIIGKRYGLFLAGCVSETVSGNRITVMGASSPTINYVGMILLDTNAVDGGTITIDSNRFNIVNTPTTQAARGNMAVWVASGMSTSTINLTNNNVLDMTYTSTGGGDTLNRGFTLQSATCTYLVEHNSINVSSNAPTTGATTGNVAAIQCSALSTSGAITIRNNIVRFNDGGTNTACITVANTTNVASLGNDLVPGASVQYGMVGATRYATLAAWQGAGFDALASGAQSTDPTVVFPAWNADLHFAFAPPTLGSVAASTVLLDIDGDDRPTTGALPGSDQVAPGAAHAQSWGFYF